MKSVAIITAGSIRSRRDGHALIGYRAGASKLTYEPAVCQVIIEHDWITASAGLTDTAEAAPNGRNTVRPQNRIARGLVKDLISFIDDLHILRQAHGPIRVWRSTITPHTRERNAIERANGDRNVWPFTGEHRRIPVLDNWIETVYMPKRYFRVLIRLPFATTSEVVFA